MSRRSLAITIATITVLLTLIGVTALKAQDGDGRKRDRDTVEAATSTTSTQAVVMTPTHRQPANATPATPAPEIRSAPEVPTLQPVPPESTATILPASEPTATAPASQPVEAPVGISIPAIDVNTSVEWVGLDHNGDMDVPSNYDAVAWYERGARPGEIGNAVIAGHLDSVDGPAVFYRLRDLKPGDQIVVTTHDGDELRFAVNRIASFDIEDAPRDEIFGASSSAHLNLITCEGTFDPSAGAYDERLVVYTTLIT